MQSPPPAPGFEKLVAAASPAGASPLRLPLTHFIVSTHLLPRTRTHAPGSLLSACAALCEQRRSTGLIGARHCRRRWSRGVGSSELALCAGLPLSALGLLASSQSRLGACLADGSDAGSLWWCLGGGGEIFGGEGELEISAACNTLTPAFSSRFLSSPSQQNGKGQGEHSSCSIVWVLAYEHSLWRLLLTFCFSSRSLLLF